MTNVQRLPGFHFPRRSPVLALIVLLHVAFIYAISSITITKPPPIPPDIIAEFLPDARPVPPEAPAPGPTIGPTVLRLSQPTPTPIDFVADPIDPISPPTGEHSTPVALASERVAPRQDARHPIGKPDYPPASIRLGETGVVTVSACVAPNGQIADVTLKTSSGYPRLDQAAIRHLRGSTVRMLPGTENARPVQMCTNLAIRFELTP